MENTPAYGATRERGANVSYADVERAALDVLATGRRPSVETVREALGRGSPATIATCLKRFWRDLGIRAVADLAAKTAASDLRHFRSPLCYVVAQRCHARSRQRNTSDSAFSTLSAGGKPLCGAVCTIASSTSVREAPRFSAA